MKVRSMDVEGLLRGLARVFRHIDVIARHVEDVERLRCLTGCCEEHESFCKHRPTNQGVAMTLFSNPESEFH